MTLLEDLGRRLRVSIDSDVNEHGTPSRDFARSFGHYSQGVRGMLAEQRERVKLQIMAGKTGQAPITDDELEAGIRQLQLEAVRELPEQELRTELERRGVVVANQPEEDT